jgi:hypothetical protein
MSPLFFGQRDWQARHFFFLSLAVTALSIIFLFAAQHLSNKLDQRWGLAEFFRGLLSGGGFLIERVSIEGLEEASTFPESMREPVLVRLNAFEGKSLLGFQLEDSVRDVQNIPWLKSVSAKRVWPSELKVQVKWEAPRLAIFSGEGWVLMNSEGDFVANSKVLFGQWTHLPQIFGLEDVLRRDVTEMNRSLQKEKEWLVDIMNWRRLTLERLGGEFLSVHIQFDSWSESPLFRAQWKPAKSEHSVELVVRYQQWQGRTESLQYVLSDLLEKEILASRISGEFPHKWIVQKKEEGV